MRKYSNEIGNSGNTDYFKVKTVTVNEDLLKQLNANYIYEHVEDFIPEVTEDNSPGVARVANDVEIVNEDIEADLTVFESTEVLLDSIEFEEEKPVSESELNNLEKGPIEESNNNQISETNDTSFEWF